MAEIGLICEASVPKGMEVKITVKEDTDHDEEFENERTQNIKDGLYVYELDGFEAERDNGWETEIELGRNPDGPNLNPARSDPKSPSVSYINMIVSGPGRSNEADPKAVVTKFKELAYFLQQMIDGNSETYRYNLSAYLNAAYTIEELLKKEWEPWSEWANSRGSAELHEMLMNSRNMSAHLRKPSKGSLKPPLGHSMIHDFGKGSKRAFFFDDVPMSVINEYLPDDERIEPADGRAIEDSSFARLFPATHICKVYISLVKRRIHDWLETLDNSNFNYDLERLR